MAEARKTVTVVFADVSDSTALGERLDPEALRRVMERYFAEARAAFERHEGTVEKFIGDAAMAVFGVPAEDDAMRAVRAAQDLRKAMTRLNAVGSAATCLRRQAASGTVRARLSAWARRARIVKSA